MCLPGPLAPNVETYSYFCGHPLLWSGPANAEHCGEGKRLVQKLLRSLVFAILPVVLSCRGGRDSITSLLAGLAEIDHMVRSLRVMFNGGPRSCSAATRLPASVKQSQRHVQRFQVRSAALFQSLPEFIQKQLLLARCC